LVCAGKLAKNLVFAKTESKYLGSRGEPRFFKKSRMGASESSRQDASPYPGGYLVGFDAAAPRVATIPSILKNPVSAKTDSKYLGSRGEPRCFRKSRMGASESSRQDASLYPGDYLVGFDVAAPRAATIPTKLENPDFAKTNPKLTEAHGATKSNQNSRMAAMESPHRDAFTDPSGGSVSLIPTVRRFVQFWTKCNFFFPLFLLLLVFSSVVELSELPELDAVHSFGICRVFLVLVDLRNPVGGERNIFSGFSNALDFGVHLSSSSNSFLASLSSRLVWKPTTILFELYRVFLALRGFRDLAENIWKIFSYLGDFSDFGLLGSLGLDAKVGLSFFTSIVVFFQSLWACGFLFKGEVQIFSSFTYEHSQFLEARRPFISLILFSSFWGEKLACKCELAF
jgi:hypothetical protein